jgi:uncharacterized membrane protein
LCDSVPHAGRSGILLAFNAGQLVDLATRYGRVIDLVPQVGDFVPRGDALFRVHPDLGPVQPALLHQHVSFGHERTLEQDPAFVFRILVDVAAKALSPAINDPTTAVIALDQIHHLLKRVGLRRLDVGRMVDRDGSLRLLYRTPCWNDFVLLAVSEIRHYGGGSIQVTRRLKAMLGHLCLSLPPQRAGILREQLSLLRKGIDREFVDPEDRTRADTSDYQGVGGCRADGDHASSFRLGLAEPGAVFSDPIDVAKRDGGTL